MKECNKCGKMSYKEQDHNYESLHEFSVTHGYYCNHDNTIHSFTLCDDCLDELFSSFRKPVEENEYL